MKALVAKLRGKIKSEHGQLAFAGAVLFVIIGAVIGWVMNIIKLALSFGDADAVTADLVIRVIGIPIAAIGAIVGWL